MNCQTFSCAFSSGHFGGSGTMVTLSGTVSLAERCQPAWSSNSAAWRPGATSAEIAARWRFMVAVLQNGRIKPTASCGQMAPKMQVEAVRWSDGAQGRLPRRASGGDLVLLADARFVAEPDFYVGGGAAAFVRDRRQHGGPVFLQAAIAPSACA